MKKELVVGMGELLFDVFPTGKKIGGAPVNFAYHAAQQGIDSMAISAVGNDCLGDEIIEILNARNLNFEVERVGLPTGTVQVTLDDKGVPSFEICENVAWDSIPITDTMKNIALRCRAFCFGTLAQRAEGSRNAINFFLDSMSTDSEVLKIYDINLRQQFYSKEIIENSLLKCNVLKINDDEFATVGKMFGFGADDYCKGSRWLISEYDLKMVILTCGYKGSYIYTSTDESFMDSPKVNVADTVGAGDSFTAAFCATLLKGGTLREAHRKAASVAAYVCTKSGAMPVLPNELK